VKRLRVLFALGSLGAGGSERQTIHLLRHLDRGRFEPSLYLLKREGDLLSEVPSDVPVGAFDDEERPALLRLPGTVRRSQIDRFEAFLRRERPDVLCERMLVTTLVTAPAAKRAGIPRVATFAADPDFDLADQAKRFRWFKQRVLRTAYHDAARLIAVSGGVARRASELYGIDADRIRVIWNPVDLERIDRLAAESPNPYPADGSFRVVSVGRLIPEKGVDVLIRAVATLIRERNRDELRLHIVGQGPEEFALKALARELGVDPHVVFEGFAANPYPFLRHANLFCLSSQTEGMPNVLLEAMACRVPVLATDCVSGPREILDGGRFGRLVPPRDAQALAEAIDDAMTKHSTWQQRVEPARDRLATHFSVDAATRAYEDLFVLAAGSE
jgi:glycosyltransferase involved in cell wall biosynthesis